MNRITFAIATLVAIVLTAGSSRANAADRFALVKIENTSTINLGFDYRFGNGPWVPVRLQPGHWYGIFAGFTGPGSYRHTTIHIRFDEDLRWGQNRLRTFMPYVRYSPDIDYNRAQLYHFDIDGDTGSFVEMFTAN